MLTLTITKAMHRYWKEPNTSSDNRKSHTILTSDIRRVMWSIGDEYWLVECNDKMCEGEWI